MDSTSPQPFQVELLLPNVPLILGDGADGRVLASQAPARGEVEYRTTHDRREPEHRVPDSTAMSRTELSSVGASERSERQEADVMLRLKNSNVWGQFQVRSTLTVPVPIPVPVHLPVLPVLPVPVSGPIPDPVQGPVSPTSISQHQCGRPFTNTHSRCFTSPPG